MLHSEPLPERSIAALTLAEFPMTTDRGPWSFPRSRSLEYGHRGLHLGTETVIHEVPPAGLHMGTNRQRTVTGRTQNERTVPHQECVDKAAQLLVAAITLQPVTVEDHVGHLV